MKVTFSKNDMSAIRGRVWLPPSKSIAHRALICAAFGKGKSSIFNIPDCDDVNATVRCLEILGVDIKQNGNCAEVDGIGLSRIKPRGIADCGESGSTLRFLVPIAAAGCKPVTFCGHGRLMSRPLGEYEKLFRIEKSGNFLTVYPGGILDGYTVDGSMSSQFSGGIMMMLAAGGIGGFVRVENEASRPYNILTCEVLGAFGIRAECDNGTYRIYGRAEGRGFEIPGDMSADMYFEMLNLLGANIEICGKDTEFTQIDGNFRKIADRMKQREVIDVGSCPDCAPALFALAAAWGYGEFTGTDRLKFKESDRLGYVKAELEKFGAQTEISDNKVRITSDGLIAPDRAIDSHGDHRIAMSLSLLLAVTGGELYGGECVSKSYPGFFGALSAINVKFKQDGI